MDMHTFSTQHVIEIYNGRMKMVALKAQAIHLLIEEQKIYQQLADEAKKELQSRGIEVDNPEKIVTTPLYWDCNCKHTYIHPKSQKFCSLCNTHQDDAPDSRVYEVLGHGYSIR